MTRHASHPAPGPYELGLSDSPDAIPRLIEYLEFGRTNEKRLAASAIQKLAAKYRTECQAAVNPLVACLDDGGSQVRQYALKALSVLRLPPEVLGQLRSIQDHDDRPYNRDLALSIIRRHPSAQEPAAPELGRHPRPDPVDSIQLRIEICLQSIDILEVDLRENSTRLLEAEDELADARQSLEHAERVLIVRGVEGKNEAERRAHLGAALPREREAVKDAERQLRVARREQEEHRDSLSLIQERLKAIELLLSLRRLT